MERATGYDAVDVMAAASGPVKGRKPEQGKLGRVAATARAKALDWRIWRRGYYGGAREQMAPFNMTKRSWLTAGTRRMEDRSERRLRMG